VAPRARSTPGPGAGGLRAHKEAPLGNHPFAWLEPDQDGHELAGRRPESHCALDELAFLPFRRNIDDRTVADRLHGGAI